MTDFTSITDARTSLKGSDPRTSANTEIRTFWIIGVLVFAAILGLWLFSGDDNRQVEFTVDKGESLAAVVGYHGAIEIAEANDLPITAKLISSKLSPADARNLITRPTDVVGVTVMVMPGAKISMTVDEDNARVPGTPIIYTPPASTR